MRSKKGAKLEAMNELFTLTCPSCGGRTTFTPGSRQITCQYCGNQHVFHLANETDQAQTGRSRPRQPRPRSVRIEQSSSGLSLKWRWFTPKYIPMAFFCIAWDSFLIFWYSMAFGMQAPWIFIVFPIAHLAIGIGLTYATLAGFINTTAIHLANGQFLVQHDPLPWPGEVRLPIEQVRQFFCRLKQAKSSNGSRSYQLVAVLEDGREINLVSNLDSPNIAWFLEQQLEAHLQIVDEPVAGELPNLA